MLGLIISILARWGVSRRLQKPLAYIALAIGFLALVALIWGVWALWLHGHDKRVVQSDRDKSNIEALTKGRKADDAAAIERQDDDAALDNQAKERSDAITAKPDDPYRALSCQRLRAAGKNQAADAAGC